LEENKMAEKKNKVINCSVCGAKRSVNAVRAACIERRYGSLDKFVCQKCKKAAKENKK